MAKMSFRPNSCDVLLFWFYAFQLKLIYLFTYFFCFKLNISSGYILLKIYSKKEIYKTAWILCLKSTTATTKSTNISSLFYNRSYFLLRRVKLGFPFLENKPMTILQIMKLLHHSQGYSQYTFIQKYRISHISHSGLNRHWSIMWALKDRGTHEDPPPVLTNSQSGSGRGVLGAGRGQQRGTLGRRGEHRWWGAAAVRTFVQQRERHWAVLSSSQQSSISGPLNSPEHCCNNHSPSAPENVNPASYIWPPQQ